MTLVLSIVLGSVPTHTNFLLTNATIPISNTLGSVSLSEGANAILFENIQHHQSSRLSNFPEYYEIKSNEKMKKTIQVQFAYEMPLALT